MSRKKHATPPTPRLDERARADDAAHKIVPGERKPATPRDDGEAHEIVPQGASGGSPQAVDSPPAALAAPLADTVQEQGAEAARAFLPTLDTLPSLAAVEAHAATCEPPAEPDARHRWRRGFFGTYTSALTARARG